MKKYMMKLMTALLVIVGMVSGPFLETAKAAEQTAAYAPIELRNATYTIEAIVTGEDGVSQIQTPTSIFVEDQKATVVMIWDSTDYNYMVVGGEKILPKSRDDGSIFWIPVSAWDEEIPLLVNRGSGSTEELSCSLYLDSTTIKKQGNMAPLYFLLVLNIILAFLNALNMIRRRDKYAERVETKEEADKFAKQQARRPVQTPQPQKRLVLDENGNFVTSDVFESAKHYKAQEAESSQTKSAPQAPPQDAPAPTLWWRRTGEETLIIDKKDDGYRVKEIRPAKPAAEEEKVGETE